MSAAKTLVVAGFSSCPFFQRAALKAKNAATSMPEKFKVPVINSFPNRDEYQKWLDTDTDRPRSDDRSKSHRSSPFVYEKESKRFIGGHDDLVKELKQSNL